MLPYWGAQLVGGFGAVLVMAIVYSSQVTDALHTQPAISIDSWAALVLEIVATALFVMVILTVATDERAAWKGVMAPLLIGLFILTAASSVGPASGGSFNPARSLDPVLYNQEWGDVWIYLVGPLAGGVSVGRSGRSCAYVRPPPIPATRPAAATRWRSSVRSRRSAGSPSRTSSARPSPTRSASNARTRAPPSYAIPGRRRERSRYGHARRM